MDIERVVEKLADRGMIRPNRIIGQYYSMCCPFHNNGNEKKPSSGIRLTEEYKNGQLYPAGLWHCFSCRRAYKLEDFIAELLKIHDISTPVEMWMEENIEGYNPNTEFEYLMPKDMMKSLTDKFAVSQMKQMTQKAQSYVSEEELSKYRFTVKYMYDRKLTDLIIDLFDVGFDANFIPYGRKKRIPCITFPVRDRSGNTLFICRRSVEGKAFYLPKDVEKPVYGLYELPKDCKSVVIAESCFNVLTSYVYGYPAVGLLGTGTPNQIKQLKSLGVSEFVVATDPDDAGDKGAAKLKRELKNVGMVRRMYLPEGKDINDLTKEEFEECYQSRL